MKIKTAWRLAVSLIACVGAAPAWALSGCLTPTEDKITQVYFANGVFIEDSTDLEITIHEIRSAYKARLEALDPDATYIVLKAYNDTQGLTDIIQVLEQKMHEEGVEDPGFSPYQMLQFLSGALNNDQIRQVISQLAGLRDRTGLVEALTDEVLERLAESLSQGIADALADRRTVTSRHINFYEADLIAGKRVFVIAHSQGNLFTNEALRAVIARQPERADSIVAIGVATPASANVARNIHITAHDDRVIDALRLIEDVLPSNLENDPGVFNDFRSFTNHYFVKDYFDSRLASRTLIDNEIERLATSVPYPRVQAGEGAIRATLTWGQQPDVDLHAYEPGGAHVYYSNRFGTSGFLDVDDVTSFGPENYFVACEDIQAGRYQIGVNYFRGSAPETATVTLFLGSGQTVTPRSIPLPSARGSGGDQSPMILFTIDVTANEDDSVSYSVTQ